jgi:hypothetical protein
MSVATNDAGNIRYMAPEQFNPPRQGMQPTAARDVYGFACVCFYVSLAFPQLVGNDADRSIRCSPNNIHSTSTRQWQLYTKLFAVKGQLAQLSNVAI